MVAVISVVILANHEGDIVMADDITEAQEKWASDIAAESPWTRVVHLDISVEAPPPEKVEAKITTSSGSATVKVVSK